MSVRLDKVLMSSLHESFKNYQSETRTITVSGSIPDLGADFSTTFTYDRVGTIADIYVSKQGSGSKRMANYAWRLPEFTHADLVGTIYVLYGSSSITVNISIVNGTGGPLTPTTQTFDIQAVVFDAPITS